MFIYFFFLNADKLFTSYFIQTAVVSALKGLQEKIRKLELERADAEDNLKKLAAESRHYKDVLQKELTVRESSQGVISKQNKRRVTALFNIQHKYLAIPEVCTESCRLVFFLGILMCVARV